MTVYQASGTTYTCRRVPGTVCVRTNPIRVRYPIAVDTAAGLTPSCSDSSAAVIRPSSLPVSAISTYAGIRGKP